MAEPNRTFLVDVFQTRLESRSIEIEAGTVEEACAKALDAATLFEDDGDFEAGDVDRGPWVERIADEETAELLDVPAERTEFGVTGADVTRTVERLWELRRAAADSNAAENVENPDAPELWDIAIMAAEQALRSMSPAFVVVEWIDGGEGRLRAVHPVTSPTERVQLIERLRDTNAEVPGWCVDSAMILIPSASAEMDALRQLVADLLPAAAAHVEDWRTGLEDGTYDDRDGLARAGAAVDRASDMVAGGRAAAPAALDPRLPRVLAALHVAINECSARGRDDGWITRARQIAAECINIEPAFEAMAPAPQTLAEMSAAAPDDDALLVASHGYVLMGRETFLALDPERFPEEPTNGTTSRADLLALKERVKQREGTSVVYDPNDNEEGWLLVGEWADIVAKTAEMIRESKTSG